MTQNWSRSPSFEDALEASLDGLRELFPNAATMTKPHVNRNGPGREPLLRVMDPMEQVRFIGVSGTPGIATNYLRLRAFVYDDHPEVFSRLRRQKYFAFEGVALSRGSVDGNDSWTRDLASRNISVSGYEALLPIGSWTEPEASHRLRGAIHQFCSFVTAVAEGGLAYERMPDVTPGPTVRLWANDEAAIDRINALDLEESERIALVKLRVGQSWFRDQLVNRWTHCAVTGAGPAELLVASHIWPWSECESANERWSVDNGLLLNPNLDKLFDRGIIGFSSKGKLLFGPKAAGFSRTLLARLGAVELAPLNYRVFTESPGLVPFLARHRALHQINE